MLHKSRSDTYTARGKYIQGPQTSLELRGVSLPGSSQQVKWVSTKLQLVLGLKTNPGPHVIFKQFNKESVGRQGIKFVSHNAFQNLTILPPHIHSSFPVFPPWKSLPTLLPFYSHMLSQNSTIMHTQPQLMFQAERGPFIISPRHLKHLSPNLKELFKASLQPKKGFFSRGEICCCYWHGAPWVNPSWKTWNWRDFADSAWYQTNSRRGSRVLPVFGINLAIQACCLSLRCMRRVSVSSIKCA